MNARTRTPKPAAPSDTPEQERLDEALEQTFPASDPISIDAGSASAAPKEREDPAAAAPASAPSEGGSAAAGVAPTGAGADQQQAERPSRAPASKRG